MTYEHVQHLTTCKLFKKINRMYKYVQSETPWRSTCTTYYSLVPVHMNVYCRYRYLCVRARVWSVSNVHMWRFMYVWSMYVAIIWMYNVLCTQASRRLLKYLSHYSWTVIYIIFSQYYLCATLCDHSIGAWISRYMNVMNSCPCNWAPLDIWQWFPLRCIESASGSKDGQWAGFKTTPP